MYSKGGPIAGTPATASHRLKGGTEMSEAAVLTRTFTRGVDGARTPPVDGPECVRPAVRSSLPHHTANYFSGQNNSVVTEVGV